MMIVFYLVGLSFILLVITSILAKIEWKLEKKNYYYLLGYSLFSLYIYLGSFLIVYLGNAVAPKGSLQDLVYLTTGELNNTGLQLINLENSSPTDNGL